jgi:hypothetical protein
VATTTDTLTPALNGKGNGAAPAPQNLERGLGMLAQTAGPISILAWIFIVGPAR